MADAAEHGEARPSGVVARGTCEADDDLVGAWERAWTRTDAILSLVADPELARAPLPDGPPLLYHLGHVAAVTAALLRLPPGADEDLADLFLAPVLPCRADLARRWPRREVVQRWMEDTRRAVRRLAASVGSDEREHHVRALDHEGLHQEHLVGLLRFLPGALKRRPHDLPAPSFATAAIRRAVRVPAGVVPAGVLGEHPIAVPAFALGSTPVMNGELFEFVGAGGYDEPRWWDRDDWIWRQRVALRHPAGWARTGRDWVLRGAFEDLPLQRVFDWPACVSLAEARAWCRWRGHRLPRETELLRAMHGGPDGSWVAHPWGDAPVDGARANLDLVRFRPCPVGSHPEGASASGVHELLGNGWEWAEPVVPDDEGHGLLLGASWATPARLARRRMRRRVPARAYGLLVKFRTVEQPS